MCANQEEYINTYVIGLDNRIEGGIPKGVRQQVEAAFLAASKNPSLIGGLAKRLQDYGLFEEYEDRFFSLVKSSKRS